MLLDRELSFEGNKPHIANINNVVKLAKATKPVKIMKLNRYLVVCLAATLSSASAFALSYDQIVCVNGPTAPAGNDPGIYYGSGNANGYFTVDTENNIELGLRAHVRYPTPQNVFNSSGNDVYSFNDSSTISPANRGSWNYDFSINVNANGSGTATLSDYTFTLMVDSNPGAGETWNSFDPTLIPDNAPSGSATIAQNSENPGFAVVGIPGYNPDIAGTYDFILSAYDLSGGLVAQTYMRVDVNGGTVSGPLTVPDTANAAFLLGLGFIGLVIFGFKQNRLQSAK